MSTSKNYNTIVDVAKDIIDSWDSYAFDSLFEINSFFDLIQAEAIHVTDEGGYRGIFIIRELSSFNIRFYSDLGRGNTLDIFSSSLKNLKDELNSQNSIQVSNLSKNIISASKIIIKYYNDLNERKQSAISSLNEIKNMKRKISRKFLLEKL